MQMQFIDRAPITGVRTTRDGYLVAEARIARTGIQNYTAGELGMTDRAPGDVIRVYRPADEVFSKDAMASMAHRPLTLDHPPVMVTADNWKEYAVGDTGGDVVRDGEFVRVPLTLMDAAAIKAVKAGKRELSVGYTCDLVIETGVTDAGETYDAWQRTPSANHLAVCMTARGGSALRIGDQSGENDVATKTITFDGLPIETTDAAEAVINKLAGQLAAATAKIADADSKVGAALASVQAKDGEIAALNAKLADASVTPAKLQALAAARAATIADAKKIAPAVAIVDTATDADIKRAAVAARLGDAAKDFSDASIDGAFAAFAKDGAGSGIDPLRQVIADGTVNIGDARTRAAAAQTKRNADLSNAWKGTPANA